MSVLALARTREDVRKYCWEVMAIHGLLTACMATLTLIGGVLVRWVAADPYIRGLGNGLLGLSLSLPFLLLLWLFRRIAYLQLRPYLSAIAAFCYAGILAGVVLFLRKLDLLSLTSTFPVMGIASLGASIVYFRGLDLGHALAVFGDIRRIMMQHWEFGRWLVALMATTWVSRDLYYLLAAVFLGPDETGALRAVNNLLSPLDQFLTALCIMLLPWMASEWSGEDAGRIHGYSLRIAAVLGFLSLGYLCTVSFLAAPLLDLLYQGKYTQYQWMVPALASVYVFRAFAAGAWIGLLASRDSKGLLLANLAGALTTLLIGVGLTKWMGLTGLASAWALSGGASAVCTIAFFRRQKPRSAATSMVETRGR